MKIAILTSNAGVEHSELADPRQTVLDQGWDLDLLATEAGEVKTVTGDTDPTDTFTADEAVKDVSPSDYDALILPGGTINADTLRLDEDAMAFVKGFVDAGKPVAAICHGPWALVQTDVLGGKTLTSYPSLRVDIQNAGGTWVDEQVQVCTAEDWTLVTSRNPDDLEAFTAKIVEVFGAQA
ncbi:type 1 glutamine amidotransferase domain-containing protein [Aeromicrobium sp. IC_218]|uniref:type 1 glutamine amidotransferase domain-containing protein n=1 Tax=Aeromicrobium sp. IC_218 TaxID=2545468 RepID=UPI0010397415|nr:type 1 glutamine amidotransferase domain-containing protein [Aeromicrobium sp. IC_218]TCI98970.1 type 1 glutamine amidotransferase [Aeromicrobium sp. IC_218]